MKIEEKDIQIYIDSANQTSRELGLWGWACAIKAIKHIEVWVNGSKRGLALAGMLRTDVYEKYPDHVNSLNCGFFFKMDFDAGIPITGSSVIVKFVDGTQKRQVFQFRQLDHDILFNNLRRERRFQVYVVQNQLEKEDVLQRIKAIEKFKLKPKISLIVPVYNVDPKWLNLCIDSVKKQLYTNWELCLFDDASTNKATLKALDTWDGVDDRIKIGYGKKNENISGASNGAIKLATGEFIGLLDNDDELRPDALFEVVKAINAQPDLDLIFSDEDKLEEDGTRADPYFKTGFNLDLLLSNNFICHFTVIRKTIGDKISWFRKGYEGAQDHDLLLRVIEQTEKIHHIPKILYHWRRIEGSTAAGFSAKDYAYEAGIRALEDYLQRNNIEGRVHRGEWKGAYRIKRKIIAAKKVSIIIPFKDKVELLQVCLDSIIERTHYSNFEILLVSNNSNDQDLFDYCRAMDARYDFIRFVEHNVPFNYSAINNWAVKQCDGDYVLLLNNDVKVITEGWLTNMVEHVQREEVGAVGCKLSYENRTIQHAGVVVGIGGTAGHLFKGMRSGDSHYYHDNLVKNVTACTGACLMLKRTTFLEVGGLDDKNLPVAFNDIDLCMKIRALGKLIVYTPYSHLFHYESISRGYEVTADKKDRFNKEAKYFRKKWDIENYQDPYYNKNLTLLAQNNDIHIG